MPVNEMNALQTSSCESDLKQVLNFNESEPTNFRNSAHSVRLLEDLQSLLKNEVLCDIRFKTDDGTIIFGHKNVLVAASSYFRAMFSTFDESNKNLVNIREIDSASFKLLVNYIYTGEIMIKYKNVQDLLSAANILQLDYVNSACAKFLETRLNPSNCIGIKELADLHDCTELLSSSEAFINKQFLKVVKGDEFLSLSCEKVIQLISCNNIAVESEEKVFECVIEWIKYDFNERENLLPKLMEHVRLPLLASKPVVLKNILEEPLLKNSPKYKDLVFEALYCNLLKSSQHFIISQTIRYQPRQFGGSGKVILLFNCAYKALCKCHTEWYDPVTKIRRIAPEMNDFRVQPSLVVIGNQFVFAIGDMNLLNSCQFVSMLDVSLPSPYWESMDKMLDSRSYFGVGVLNDCIYVVGGYNNCLNTLNTAEVFDVDIQKWRMVTSMTCNRSFLAVGVLNNRLYAIGGYDGNDSLRSVECYDPTLDTWTPHSELSVRRYSASVGVLDGVLYAIGGRDGLDYHKSVEAYRPSDGVWSFVADMHLCRFNAGVVALDGLLYVIGGELRKPFTRTIEVYNPNTNTWSMETYSRNNYDVHNWPDFQVYGGVVVNRPPYLITNEHI